MFTYRWAWPARCPIRPILGFWWRKVHKNGMGVFLPWTPMNRCAKCDAASFILGGEIHNCTNKQTKLQTNSKRYIHTYHTDCLSVAFEKCTLLTSYSLAKPRIL